MFTFARWPLRVAGVILVHLFCTSSEICKMHYAHYWKGRESAGQKTVLRISHVIGNPSNPYVISTTESFPTICKIEEWQRGLQCRFKATNKLVLQSEVRWSATAYWLIVCFVASYSALGNLTEPNIRSSRVLWKNPVGVFHLSRWMHNNNIISVVLLRFAVTFLATVLALAI